MLALLACWFLPETLRARTFVFTFFYLRVAPVLLGLWLPLHLQSMAPLHLPFLLHILPTPILSHLLPPHDCVITLGPPG